MRVWLRSVWNRIQCAFGWHAWSDPEHWLGITQVTCQDCGKEVIE